MNKKLSKMKFTDGKQVDDSITFANIRTIDELIGVESQTPFKQKSLAEFEEEIDKKMNLADMQELAVRVGLLPIHDRPMLKKRLIDEFKRHLRNWSSAELNASSVNNNVKKSLKNKVTSILKEGS